MSVPEDSFTSRGSVLAAGVLSQGVEVAQALRRPCSVLVRAVLPYLRSRSCDTSVASRQGQAAGRRRCGSGPAIL